MNDPGNPFSSAVSASSCSPRSQNESLCDASSWLLEQAIDVHGCTRWPRTRTSSMSAQRLPHTGLFNSEQNVIDNHLANVVSNSWGDPGGDLTR